MGETAVRLYVNSREQDFGTVTQWKYERRNNAAAFIRLRNLEYFLFSGGGKLTAKRYSESRSGNIVFVAKCTVFAAPTSFMREDWTSEHDVHAVDVRGAVPARGCDVELLQCR